MASVYQWKRAAQMRGDAQQAGEALQALQDRYGQLSPELVVQAAHPARSPLHHYFEWNEHQAAAQYRMVQARQLIRSIQVVIRPEGEADEHPIEVRAFVSVAEEGVGRYYVGTEAAMEDPVLRSQILEQARRALITWRNRYHQLEELAEVVSVIEDFVGLTT